MSRDIRRVFAPQHLFTQQLDVYAYLRTISIPSPQTGPIIGDTTSFGKAGPTTFVYTTTDNSGNKVVVTAVFTPTYQPTQPNPSLPAGTIVNYSDFTANFPMSNSATAGERLAGARRVMGSWGLAGAITVLGAVIGFRVVL